MVGCDSFIPALTSGYSRRHLIYLELCVSVSVYFWISLTVQIDYVVYVGLSWGLSPRSEYSPLFHQQADVVSCSLAIDLLLRMGLFIGIIAILHELTLCISGKGLDSVMWLSCATNRLVKFFFHPWHLKQVLPHLPVYLFPFFLFCLLIIFLPLSLTRLYILLKALLYSYTIFCLTKQQAWMVFILLPQTGNISHIFINMITPKICFCKWYNRDILKYLKYLYTPRRSMASTDIKI